MNTQHLSDTLNSIIWSLENNGGIVDDYSHDEADEENTI